MSRVPLYVIGGFLGAGKTTLLATLGQHFATAGERVAVVTNDQSVDLVDTRLLQARGLAVEEVTGACFCCSFNDLVARLESLQRQVLPTVILAEPVGSCTDLSATVLQPLKRFYGDQLDVRPFAVLIDPVRAHPILTRRVRGGYSPRAAYIYRKQLEEADVLVINKVDDKGRASLREDVKAILTQMFPTRPVIEISARCGTGIGTLLAVLSEPTSGGRQILDIDYDIYATEEAELGWLNASAYVKFKYPQKLSVAGTFVVQAFQQLCRLETGGDIAHLKVSLLGNGHLVVCNATAIDESPLVSNDLGVQALETDILLNCRAFADPASLEQVWRRLLLTMTPWTERVEDRGYRVLRPGRPVPTYRITETVGGGV